MAEKLINLWKITKKNCFEMNVDRVYRIFSHLSMSNVNLCECVMQQQSNVFSTKKK